MKAVYSDIVFIDTCAADISRSLPWQGHQSEEEDSRPLPEAAQDGATPRQRNREDDFYDTDDSFIDDDDLVRGQPGMPRKSAEYELVRKSW